MEEPVEPLARSLGRIRDRVAWLPHRGARSRLAQESPGPRSCRAPRQSLRSASGSSPRAMVVDNCVNRDGVGRQPELSEESGHGVDRFDQWTPCDAGACHRVSSHFDRGSGRWLRNVRTGGSFGTRPQAWCDDRGSLVAGLSLRRPQARLVRRVGQTGKPTLVVRIALPAGTVASSWQRAHPRASRVAH